MVSVLYRNLGSEQRWLSHSQLWQPTSTKVFFHSLGFKTFLRIMDYCIYQAQPSNYDMYQLSEYILGKWLFHASSFSSSLPHCPIPTTINKIRYPVLHPKKGQQKLQLQLKFIIRYIRKVKGLWIHLSRKVIKTFKRTCLGELVSKHSLNNIHHLSKSLLPVFGKRIWGFQFPLPLWKWFCLNLIWS